MRMSALMLASSLLASIAAIGCAGSDTPEPALDTPALTDRQPPAAEDADGRVGEHGMVLFGTRDRAYLSHIPMFNAPHDVQAIVEVSFRARPGVALPATFSNRLFTFLPDTASLDALRLGSLRTLHGTIFLGNFEQGGRPVVDDVDVDVARVVHQHVLDADAPVSTRSFVFGSGNDVFAVQRIGGAASSDRIRAITFGTRRPSAADLERGVELEAKDLDGARELELSCLVGPGFVNACDPTE